MKTRKLTASFLIAAGVMGAGTGCDALHDLNFPRHESSQDPPFSENAPPPPPPPLPPPSFIQPPPPGPRPSNELKLKRAKALAEWAVGKAYSQDMSERDCTARDNPREGFPDAPFAGPPSSTGACAQYDCSSLVTWILRQIPDQTAVEPAGWIHNTYWLWTGDTYNTGVGPTPPNTPSPVGWEPCDPNEEDVCVGFTEWGEGYQGKPSVPGPGHVVISLEQKFYSASGSRVGVVSYSNWQKPPRGSNQQGSGRHKIVWVKPPGV